jgi:TonB-dependent starch-binding outer membrane protein SusC
MIRCHCRRAALTLLALLCVTHSAASGLNAQERGSITGRVVDAVTQRPIASVQVHIPGTALGALTNSSGRFLLLNVPPGQVVVRTQLLGYSTTEQVVQVVAGEATTVNFQLAQQALHLDEVVVTGTAGQARRREVGNTIAQINPAQISDPVTTVDGLLQGRAAGVSVMGTGGALGAGAAIRLRGNVSTAMSNQPIIYVDGVRMRSDGYPKNMQPGGSTFRSSHVVQSPLNDLNPNDIERVEIVRGPAAATLYGSEAAAGVIQIFTRRGAAGRPTFTLQTDQGFDRFRPFGPPNNPYMNLEPWLKTAHRQKYSLSVRGGSSDVLYYVSATLEDNEGVLPNDAQDRRNARLNLSFSPFSTVQLELNSSYTNSWLQSTPSGNNANAFLLNVFRGDANAVGSGKKEDIDRFLDWEITDALDRLVTGFSVSHSPTTWFNQRATLGYDRASLTQKQHKPFGYVGFPAGRMSSVSFDNTHLTLDYLGSVDFRISGDLRSRFSVGGQSITAAEHRVGGRADGFAGPGEPTLSSGGLTVAAEEALRVITAGGFVQNMFDFRDRLFLTAALRVDGSSAFGSDLGLQVYPKVSASYVISDEPFWRDGWGDVKLRLAYGHAGRAPGAFDAVRTWNPNSWVGGATALLPGVVGNALLGPEKTAETEVGFDASFLDQRLTTEVTYYHQRTRDALFRVGQIPSLGFTTSQLTNVGEFENRGVEVSVQGRVIQRQNFGWNLGLNVSTNNSKALSVGPETGEDAEQFSLGRRGYIRLGQPVPVISGRLILNPNELADPEWVESHNFGPNSPTLMWTGSTSFDLPRGLQLSARGEFAGGHYMWDEASTLLAARSIWPPCEDAYAKLAAGQRDQLTAWHRIYCDVRQTNTAFYVWPADMFRLRDITLTAPVDFLVRGASSARLSLSLQNAWKWRNSDLPLFDPDMVGRGVWEEGGMNTRVRYIDETAPPPATVTASMRVTF